MNSDLITERKGYHPLTTIAYHSFQAAVLILVKNYSIDGIDVGTGNKNNPDPFPRR